MSESTPSASQSDIQLFHSSWCGFCIRVRRFMAAHRIDLPLRDVDREPDARQALIAGGGRATVPCLRIESAGSVHWLYESLDIIEYLRGRFVDESSG